MRRLIMWNLMTLDGFVEGPNRDISWHSDVWGPELERLSIEQGPEIGGLVFGRVTYDLMAGYWPTAGPGPITDYMNGLPKYVFSRHMTQASWSNATVMQGDPMDVVARLKQEDGKDLFVFGSADLSSQIMPLFDELRIAIVPRLLGAGSLLFKSTGTPAGLRLLSTDQHSNGVVIARYAQGVRS